MVFVLLREVGGGRTKKFTIEKDDFLVSSL